MEGTAKQKRDVSSLYHLSGVVVHSGQANAGHYYSFIRSRGSSEWFKFNDDTVTPITMTTQTMVEECFGGEFESKGSTRNRYWNAYILLYDKATEFCPPSPWKKPSKPISPTKRLKASRLSRIQDDVMDENEDPVNALEELIKTGERSGMFTERLPPLVRNSIVDSNIKLLKEKAVFNESYFGFIKKLATSNISASNVADYCGWNTKLLCNFFLHTYLHVTSQFHFLESSWEETFKTVLSSDPSAVDTFLEFISSTRNQDYLVTFLLTCPKHSVRSKFAGLVKLALEKVEPGGESAVAFLGRYLAIMTRDIPENNKHSEQYFNIIHHFAKLSTQSVQQLLVGKFIPTFLGLVLSSEKWTSNQLSNFSGGYYTLGLVLAQTDLGVYQDHTGSPHPLCNVTSTYQSTYNFTNPSALLSHLVLVCHSVSQLSVANTLYLLSWRNKETSLSLISYLMTSISTVQGHELKPLFTLLLSLLQLEDTHQIARLERVIGGEPGLFGIVKTSSETGPKRAYQCVKFFTQLLRTNPSAKDHITTHIPEWQWSVNWLRTAFETGAKSSSSSNESATVKGFQRTTSAQETLTDATALLNEIENSSQ
eukprot:sb/3463248/